MDFRTLVLFSSVWTSLLLPMPTASGQIRDRARSVVDSVQTKNQKAMRGFVLDEDAIDGISIAVSKQWLEKEVPDIYAKSLDLAEQAASAARIQLRDRLKILIDLKEGAFQFLIRKELDRIELEIEKPPNDDYQFFTLRVKSNSVTSRNLASGANRRIAIWSWHERLADVETQKPNILASELKSRNIDATSLPPSLASRFYPKGETEEQWTTRVAIVAHRLDKQIEFQGTGDIMVAVGGDQPPDLASLMGQLMQSQMTTLLQELTNGTSKPSQLQRDDIAWTNSAIAQAEKMDAAYFRATQVRLDPLLGSAVVDSLFMVKQSGGKWTVVWRNLSTQNANDQKQETVQRIKDDPQVKAIQSQFEKWGGTSVSLDSALRMGAATMTAQNSVTNEFQTFSESFLRRLDSPSVHEAKKMQANSK